MVHPSDDENSAHDSFAEKRNRRDSNREYHVYCITWQKIIPQKILKLVLVVSLLVGNGQITVLKL